MCPCPSDYLFPELEPLQYVPLLPSYNHRTSQQRGQFRRQTHPLMHLILLVKNTNKKGGNLGNIKKKEKSEEGKEGELYTGRMATPWPGERFLGWNSSSWVVIALLLES
jgi:hypothetical protein